MQTAFPKAVSPSRSLVLLGLVIALAAATAPAQTADLRWRWTPGTTDRFRLVESMHQTVSGDEPVELDWIREIEFTQRVDAEGDGVTVIRTFDAVAVRVTRSDTPDAVRYDSRDPSTQTAAAHPLVVPFTQMVGRELRLRLDAESRVVAVNGPDELLRAMLGPLEQSAPGLSGLLPAPPPSRRLVEQTQAALDLIPNRRVRRGQSWPVEVPHEVPLVGSLDSAVTAALERVRRGVATVRVEGKFTQTEGEAGATLLELKRSAITGEIEFDLQRGQPNRQRLDIESSWSAASDLLDALGAEPTEQTLRQTAELTRLSQRP